MTSCLLPWFWSRSERSRKVAAADRLGKRSLEMRPEVSDQSRNRWLVALLRAFAGLWPC
jgi:hypothetical protein